MRGEAAPAALDTRAPSGGKWVTWALAIALFFLVGCSRSGAVVGKPFTLRQGDTVGVRGTGLRIETESVTLGQPGSQEMKGFASLWVRMGDEKERRVLLEKGEQIRVGEYEIRLENVICDAVDCRCIVLVTR
jgi:hypothetical protein